MRWQNVTICLQAIHISKVHNARWFIGIIETVNNFDTSLCTQPERITQGVGVHGPRLLEDKSKITLHTDEGHRKVVYVEGGCILPILWIFAKVVCCNCRYGQG